MIICYLKVLVFGICACFNNYDSIDALWLPRHSDGTQYIIDLLRKYMLNASFDIENFLPRHEGSRLFHENYPTNRSKRTNYLTEIMQVSNESFQNLHKNHYDFYQLIKKNDSTSFQQSKNQIFVMKNHSLLKTFTTSLNKFEKMLYQICFNKFLSISPLDRKENGISFTQTGLFLYMALMALSTEVGLTAKAEIKKVLNMEGNITGYLETLKTVTEWLPISSKDVKFRWASRLVVNAELPISKSFEEGPAKEMNLQITRLNETHTSKSLTRILNKMVEIDSGGSLRHTFDEDDLNSTFCSILIMTVSIRASWRSSPTVLNGTKPFFDFENKKNTNRSVRMIRLNDIMRYATLDELDAEAIEISYATPGLTLLLLVPKSHSLKKLAISMAKINLNEISKNMTAVRIAAILPLYTLRTTLLLPEKLREMGITHLLHNEEISACDKLKVSQAVQRLMFWSEPGRNAYKDDGIEWDETPEREVKVNRPYIFYVRWYNVTVMNGNFVL